MSRPAAFLDRDGTLNRRPPEHDYVRSSAGFAWLPGAADGAAALAEAGYVLAIVSNQRGIARGLVSHTTLEEIEMIIQRELAERGCRAEVFRYCPHEHDDGCTCRKPAPGMLVELAEELGLDLARSWMIGDSEDDVLAGEAAGCRTALIGARPSRSRPDLVAASLLEAGKRISAG
jgi:D-glycero-D-manno-heptose 1,7-bisphosphate phosphatase